MHFTPRTEEKGHSIEATITPAVQRYCIKIALLGHSYYTFEYCFQSNIGMEIMQNEIDIWIVGYCPCSQIKITFHFVFYKSETTHSI